jgi:hypothetical protein
MIYINVIATGFCHTGRMLGSGFCQHGHTDPENGI